MDTTQVSVCKLKAKYEMEKFIFIDRDGVINRDPAWEGKDYVIRWADFQFLPGALKALKYLTDKGYKIAIISNQAGVGKGVYTKEKLDEITEKMLNEIESKGGKIYSVQYCLHTSDDNCECRKPKAGLFKTTTEGFKIDFSKTYFIGDTKRDIEAGKKIGCKTILVLSGKVRDASTVAGWTVKPDFVKKDLSEAARDIIK